ncbi:RHS repeat domain-containing protein [Kosakonia sacchari]|uniref:RHS repeat domain-containing protein n=1 Tax=Kosakonia sacchari TaxID=1158459 RepID=UPI00136415CC|nr:RHS repeat domain-containing protein [Kosakonia sacchari]QHM95138.1 RHS repeat protein [Kosakonia sacchari]
MTTSLYVKTPTVVVLNNRGLAVRDIVYHRHPETPDTTNERITRHQFDARGLPSQSVDPRLYAAGLANFEFTCDLNGAPLRTQSADAGTVVVLSDASGRTFLQVSNIGSGNDRSAAVTRTFQYEEADLPGRLLGITEQVAGGSARVTERFVRGGHSADEQSYNLAGQLVSHYDPAGLLSTTSISLNGVPLAVTRQLLPDDTDADWQGADASAWNDLLAGETYTTTSTVDAAGNVLTTLDAKGNMQRVAYDVAGLLKGSWLTVNGGSGQIIVKSLTWSAAGQKLREEHGNGVVTTYSYEAETQRLVGIKTERMTPAKVLQDLRYEYDPVGNVLVITNDAEETRFWRNQEVVSENHYAYDSLYQLVSASGREMASAVQQNSNLPDVTSFDNATYTNYTRTYTYDNAGNLTKIQHSAPASGNNYTTSITVSDRSNRAVISTLTENPADVEALFTAGGQQQQLLPGQSLLWTARQELQQVTPVTRSGAADDSERYRYDAGSQRIVKITSQLTGNSTQTRRVIYLPGLELRSSAAEELQVITVGVAGRAQVRVLHWESGQPEGISNDAVRYSYDNLTGSSSLEVDSSGELISQEEYYPFGGTALFAARSQLEADYKTIRYSGKEQDATGLYYYGYRYYQPWAGRWLSADPAGGIDGLNLFRMVRNNPVALHDPDGLVPRIAFLKGKKLMETVDYIASKQFGTLEEVLAHLKFMRLNNYDEERIYTHFKHSRQYTGAPASTQAFSYPDLSPKDQQALDYIANRENFSHLFVEYSGDEGFSIESKSLKTENIFTNKFLKDVWVFAHNFRVEPEPYFATHIAQYQYKVAAENSGFLGEMPKKIIRKSVINEQTLNETEGLTGKTLFEAFFQRTPNGKSTARILDAFNLIAIGVTREESSDDDEGPSFIIDVVYKNNVVQQASAVQQPAGIDKTVRKKGMARLLPGFLRRGPRSEKNTLGIN